MRAAPVVLGLSTLGLLVVGCGSGDSTIVRARQQSAAPSAEAMKAPAAGAPVFRSQAGVQAAAFQAKGSAGAMTPPSAPRMIVRDANLSVRVDNVAVAEREVRRIAQAVGGDIEGSQGGDLAGPAPTLNVTLRVPEPRFDDAIARIEALGVRLDKSIRTEDVTTQAVDLDARLKSLRVQEDAYRTILGGARRIPDVLEVQERLTGVRTEIEQLVAQRRDLGDQAARSSLTVALTQSLRASAPVARVEPDWVAQTWGAATGTVKGIGQGVAQIGLWGAAMTPIWLPVGLLLLFMVRRTRNAPNRG